MTRVSASPRLSPLWLAPLALWATPFPESDGRPWRIALALAVCGATLAASALVRTSRAPARPLETAAS